MRAFLIFVILCVGFTNTAHAAPPPPEAYGSLPRVFDAAISPDGKQVALIRMIGGRYHVHVLSLSDDEEKPRVVGLEKGVKPRSVVWVNPNRLLVSFWQSQKLRGLPLTTGYLFSLDTQSMVGKVLVKPDPGELRQYNNVVVDYLEDDPDHILMAFSKGDNNAQPDLRKVNVATGRSRIVKRGLANVQYWYTDLRGEPRIGQGMREGREESWVLRVRDANGKTWREADDFPGLAPDTAIRGFTADPNELIISDYQGKDTLGLYIYNLEEKAITRKLFHNDRYDASGVILSHDGSEVIGASFVGETTEVELFDDYATVLSKLRADFPEHTVDFIDQTSDSRLILVKVSNNFDPGFFFLYDAKTGDLITVGDLYPGIPNEQLGEIVSVSYTARDGAKIPTFITLPPSITETSQFKNVPFIILPHGGPYGRDAKRFDYFAQFFASRGYGVMQMNFRGSDGYGKSYEESGRKNWVVMQEDVEDGARWLLQKGYADPERMCIAGWSYGGYAALMGALKTPELYRCAISMAGVTDLQDMIRDIKRYRFGRIAARNFVLNGFESKDDIKANSPVKLAAELKVPLFLAHGTDDQRVHFDQFKRMQRALRKVDTSVTFLSFKDEDHFLSDEENRIAFFEGIDKFLMDNIGPSPFVL